MIYMAGDDKGQTGTYSGFADARRFVLYSGAATGLSMVLGLLFPLDFLLHLDAYRLHLAPLEIARLFAWGWLVELVLYLAVIGLGLGIALALRSRWPEAANRVSKAAVVLPTLVVAGLTLANTLFTWIRMQPWWQGAASPPFKFALVSVITAVMAVVVLRRGPRERVGSLARGGLLFTALIALAGIAGLLADLWAAPLQPAWTTPQSRVPIVMISIDALSADHLSGYGYARPTSPRLDEFMKTGTRHDRFFSVSNWTSPGTNALINGVRPWDSGLLIHHARAPRSISRDGLPATLQREGYQTFMVVTNSYASPYIHRNENDWDTIRFDSDWSWGPQCYWQTFEENFVVLKALRQLGNRAIVSLGLRGPAEQFDPERAFAMARALIAHRDTSRPFFLWIHLLPPHDPYASPAPYAGLFDSSAQARTMFDSLATYHAVTTSQAALQRLLEARYDESIRYVDHHVGAFLDWLRTQALFDPAVIAVTADHGESFSHDYGGHGGTAMHSELIHVPLIVKAVGQKTASVSLDVADQSALANLLLADAGLAPLRRAPPFEAPATAWPVQSWSTNFEHSAAPDRRFSSGSVAAISWPWKYVHYREAPERGQVVTGDELFDLEHDPGETTNAIARQPQVADALRGAIESQIQHRLAGGR